MYKVFTNLMADEANLYGLVLSSADVTHHVRRGEHGWEVYVRDMDYEKALYAIEEYLSENRDAHLVEEVPAFEYGRTFSGLWVSLVVVALHVGVALSRESGAFIKTYGLAVYEVLHGELYRTVTSLFIHADTLHLAGNVLGIALFCTAVCQITGPGVGWLMILLTGLGGNLMNALLYKSHHLSVGSSTAVFGAVGILAGYQFFKKLRPPGRRHKAWLPLAGGLALLAFLGAGKHSDLTGHLFGFLVGIVVGVLYAFLASRPGGKLCQVSSLAIALMLVVIAWTRAF
jgi:membrane associated rhomboid family serine protease